MKNNFLFIAILFVGLFISSCYKDSSYLAEDYDLTITHYDTEFDFSSYKTFFLRDSVVIISDYIVQGDLDWKRFYKTGGPSNQIRNSIRQHYTALGYTEIKDSISKADVAVNMVITLDQETSTSYYPGYWWGYPSYWGGYYPSYFKSSKYWSGYWGGYWGGYYPWYGGGYSSYTYQTGSLMIEMADGNALRKWYEYIKNTTDPSPSDPNAPKLKFVWSAFIDGIQNGNTDTERLLEGIDEAYANSPYLN